MPGRMSPIGRPMSAMDLAEGEKALAAAAFSSAAVDGCAAASGKGGAQTGGGAHPFSCEPKGEVAGMGHLYKIDWVQEMMEQQGMETPLIGEMAGEAMSKLKAAEEAGAANTIGHDHMFLSLLRQDLIRDMLFLWNPQQRTFHTLMSVGMDVCGHPTIVHGGFTSAMIDETTGGLVFELKKAGELGEGSAFTARLEVDYKRPMPSNSDVVCTARVEKVEGRKAWIIAEVADRPGGNVYATGRALFVTPRSQAEKQQQEQQQEQK